jgi:exonuclease SbcD
VNSIPENHSGQRDSFRFIHAADLHLDSPLENLKRKTNLPIEELKSASRDAFLRLIDLCISEKVDFLVLAGDIYDGKWKDVQPAIFFGGQLKRLRGAGIETYIILGNHDFSTSGAKGFKTFVEDNATVFSEKSPETHSVPGLNVAIHGQSFASREMTSNLASHYPDAEPEKFNIGILHTALEGRVGHDSYAPTSVAELSGKAYDYWALGHIHKREVVQQNPHIVFSGNIQGRHIKETGAKGVYLIDVHNGELAAMDFHELGSFRWEEVQVKLTEPLNLAQVVVDCRNAEEHLFRSAYGKRLIIRLVLNADVAADWEILEERIRQSIEDFADDSILLSDLRSIPDIGSDVPELSEDLDLYFSDLDLSAEEMEQLLEASLGSMTAKLKDALLEAEANDDGLPGSDLGKWKREAISLLRQDQYDESDADAN